jgi:hypothetical protein
MFGSFMNVFFVPLLKVDYAVITDLLDERILVGGAFAEKLIRQPVNKPVEGTFTQHFIHGPVAFSEMFLLPYISQFIDNKFKLTITHFNNCVLYSDM